MTKQVIRYITSPSLGILQDEIREDEVPGPFLKEKMSGCSSSVRSKKETQIFQGCKKLVGTVLGAETVLDDSHALPCGSTPRAVQHRAAAASVGSGNLSANSFSKGGSTPRSSSMINSLGPVNSDFKNDSVRFAGKTNLDPLTRVFSWQELGTRLGVLSRLRSGHSSRQVDSVVRGSQVAPQLNSCSHSVSSHNIELVRDLSSCHLAPASKSAPLPSSVSVGCGRRARWSGRGSAFCCSREGIAALVESVCYWHLEMIHGIRVWDTVRGKMQSLCMKWLGEQCHSVLVLGPRFGNHSKV